MDNIIGIAKKPIADNEYCISINYETGDIKSDKIKFLPWGKKKLREFLYKQRESNIREGPPIF